jgi:hypothetical protein
MDAPQSEMPRGGRQRIPHDERRYGSIRNCTTIETRNRSGRSMRTRENREDMMIELLERQKKLTANQWKLICTANVADLLDFFDFFLIG